MNIFRPLVRALKSFASLPKKKLIPSHSLPPTSPISASPLAPALDNLLPPASPPPRATFSTSRQIQMSHAGHASRDTTGIHLSDLLLDHQYISLESGLPIVIVAGTEEYLAEHVVDVNYPSSYGSPGWTRIIAHHPSFMPTINRHMTMLYGHRTCIVKVIKKLDDPANHNLPPVDDTPRMVRGETITSSLSLSEISVLQTHGQLLEDQYTLIKPGMHMIVSGGDHDYLVQLQEFVSGPFRQGLARLGELRIIAADCFAMPAVGSSITVLLGGRACIAKVTERFYVSRTSESSAPNHGFTLVNMVPPMSNERTSKDKSAEAGFDSPPPVLAETQSAADETVTTPRPFCLPSIYEHIDRIQPTQDQTSTQNETTGWPLRLLHDDTNSTRRVHLS